MSKIKRIKKSWKNPAPSSTKIALRTSRAAMRPSIASRKSHTHPDYKAIIHDTIAAITQTFPSLTPEAKAHRLHGIGLILNLIGEKHKSRYAIETAEIIRESEKAQMQFHQAFMESLR